MFGVQSQGRIVDAITQYEKALELLISLHGAESVGVRRACDALCDVLNGAALKHLQSGTLSCPCISRVLSICVQVCLSAGPAHLCL